MTTLENVILLAAWISSFGLLGFIVVSCAQADAAREKLVD